MKKITGMKQKGVSLLDGLNDLNRFFNRFDNPTSPQCAPPSPLPDAVSLPSMTSSPQSPLSLLYQ